ncbi:MAG: PD-(D/E)XK nuclease family protein [Spirochaetaceae bacterium]|jgi:hypothetical protein|nr:PD-(D/E)XK nuclease family protein [Spirochaetaceae bacterium]
MTVFETILRHIGDQHTCFVFPSETAAALWARKICIHGPVRSLAPGRFLAWDRFKETAIRIKDRRRPVSSLIRRLFARSLVRENAAAPFFTALIPPAFAEGGTVFASSIAAMLPSLALWETLHGSPRTEDDEDRDLRILKRRYGDFLETHGLFEPSWEKVPFHGGRYILFFPEVLDDFTEYQHLLQSEGTTLYPVPGAAPGLLFFDSARTELRTAAMELRRLHDEEGIPYEDMALSLPDMASMAPYVFRELALYDIPCSLRSGKSLGDYPLGRLFSLIGQCTSSLFSFDSLKPLLLNGAIPWKEPAKNRALIDFGLEYHCVSPFRDQDRVVDPWEEGFSRRPHKELAGYYRGLKQTLSAMAAAKSFAEIERRYFSFRPFLTMETCSPKNNAVLARCIEELSALIETEAEFPGLADADPFGFYVSHLRDKNYVYVDEAAGGVNIYDYRVAAGAPFGCHMVLNASQGAVTVQHQPLRFLRQDKRTRLGLKDRDMSGALVSLYSIAPWGTYTCHTRISAAERTFSGWAIPHSVFALNTGPRESPCPADPFTAEQGWWAGTGEKPPLMFSVQRRGFSRWNRLLHGFSSAAAGDAPRAGATPGEDFAAAVSVLLRERIRSKSSRPAEGSAAGGGAPELSVSATDLTEFFTCPLFWLYRRIFRLRPRREDAALLDDESRGLIYHEILRCLFARIKAEDACFSADRLDTYLAWAAELTGTVLRSDTTLRGPLVYPLLLPLGDAMNKRLRELLKTEARYFSGFKVADLEQAYEYTAGPLRLTGRIDRVSLSPQGEPLIIDYKTNTAPSKPDSRKSSAGDPDEPGIRDFQIPMYIKLYEENTGRRVGRAFFVVINRHEIVPVMGDLEGKRDLCSRDDYEPAMAALEAAMGIFTAALLQLNFIPGGNPGSLRGLPRLLHKTCMGCDYNTLCRSLYSLNPPPVLFRPPAALQNQAPGGTAGGS